MRRKKSNLTSSIAYTQTLTKDFILGRGYQSINDGKQTSHTAMQATQKRNLMAKGFSYIGSVESYEKSLIRLSVSAKVPVSTLAKISGTLSGGYESNKTRISCIVLMFFTAGHEYLDDPRLNQQATQMLNSGEFFEFYNLYGNEYISDIYRGAYLVAKFDIYTEQVKKYASELVEAEAINSIMATFTGEIKKDKSLNITNIQINLGGTLTRLTTFAQLQEACEKFSKEVEDNKKMCSAAGKDPVELANTIQLFDKFDHVYSSYSQVNASTPIKQQIDLLEAQTKWCIDSLEIIDNYLQALRDVDTTLTFATATPSIQHEHDNRNRIKEFTTRSLSQLNSLVEKIKANIFLARDKSIMDEIQQSGGTLIEGIKYFFDNNGPTKNRLLLKFIQTKQLKEIECTTANTPIELNFYDEWFKNWPHLYHYLSGIEIQVLKKKDDGSMCMPGNRSYEFYTSVPTSRVKFSGYQFPSLIIEKMDFFAYKGLKLKVSAEPPFTVNFSAKFFCFPSEMVEFSKIKGWVWGIDIRSLPDPDDQTTADIEWVYKAFNRLGKFYQSLQTKGKEMSLPTPIEIKSTPVTPLSQSGSALFHRKRADIKFQPQGIDPADIQSIHIVGDFNGWLNPQGGKIAPTKEQDEAYGLRYDKSTNTGYTHVDLPPQTHTVEYKFVINKSIWKPDGGPETNKKLTVSDDIQIQQSNVVSFT